MSQKIEAPCCAVPCLLSSSGSRPGRSLGSSVRYLGNDSQRLLKVNSTRFGNAPNSAAPICRSLTKKELGGDPARPVDCLPNHPHSGQVGCNYFERQSSSVPLVNFCDPSVHRCESQKGRPVRLTGRPRSKSQSRALHLDGAFAVL